MTGITPVYLTPQSVACTLPIMVGWVHVALLVRDADRLKFAGVFPVLGGLTWRVPVVYTCHGWEGSPFGACCADTGNPAKEAAVSMKSQQ